MLKNEATLEDNRVKSLALDYETLIPGGGIMGQFIRQYNWSKTSLGSISDWPQSLLIATNLILSSQHPMWIGWGSQLTFLYNDAYVSVLGAAKHPWALGQPAREVWNEIWDVCGPLADKVLQEAKSTFVDNVRLFMNRADYLEEVYYSFSYSPIRDKDGKVQGLFCPSAATTEKVLSERRLKTLGELSAKALIEKTVQSTCLSAMKIIEKNADDIPFALLYLNNPEKQNASLIQSIRLSNGLPFISPSEISLEKEEQSFWPIANIIKTDETQLMQVSAVSTLPLGLANQRISEALILPLKLAGRSNTLGVLILGVNPCRKLDAEYRTFYDLIATQIATAIQNAKNYEEEKKQAEKLEELDKAKTAFFSNVSHEFRTPLTLILGQMDEILANQSNLSSSQKEALDMINRNALRLLKLVNSLLDFSRLEAGKVKPQYAPIKLEETTAHLASMFRSTIEKDGLQFIVDVAPLREPVYVDSSMWEKIIFNLLSNAFKYTQEGTIQLRLFKDKDKVILQVKDTGVGIPEAELPHMFQRFHRVENTQGRSYEGTGIGLALVQEIVKLHNGTISVQSELHKGSVFTVELPLGRAHLSPQQIVTNTTPLSSAIGQAFIEEANKWLPSSNKNSPKDSEIKDNFEPSRRGSYVLVADDNADMRDYIQHLLGKHWKVETVTNGEEALTAVEHRKPDIIISDIMMPKIDGFQLLKRLKDQKDTQHTPVILLSARAGEEARAEGIQKGADDYLTKPFSSKELLARVNAHLELAFLRQNLLQEIAEKTQALQESNASLLKEKAAYQALSDNLPIGVVKMDADGRLIYANKEIEAITGIKRSEITEIRLIEATHPEDAARLMPLWEQLKKTGGALDTGEYRYIRPDGAILWITGKMIAEKELEKPITEVISTMVDITPIKKLEESRLEALKIAKANEELRAETAEKHKKEQEKFIDILCHELRNPLNSIMGNLELLKLQLEKTKKAYQLASTFEEEYLEAIELSLKHQKVIINDVLDMSKIDSGKLKLQEITFDVTDIIQNVCKMFASEAENKNLKLKVSGELLTVISDPDRLKQVLINLIANAIKFTENGTVEIILTVLEKDEKHALFEIKVKDTGVGMNEEELNLLFERFSQISSHKFHEHGGSGLGLWISKQLVKLMGGTIFVKSERGRGSEFSFTIKAKTLQDEISLNKKEEVLSLPKGDGTILLVEDNKLNQKMMKKLLEIIGFEVLLANNGLEAIDAFKSHCLKLKAILMDIEMPKMNGIEATKKIRILEGNKILIPIIGLSGNAREEHKEIALEAGMNAYLTKPVKKETLYDTLLKEINKSKQKIEANQSTVSTPLSKALESNPQGIPRNILVQFEQSKNVPPVDSSALEDREEDIPNSPLASCTLV